MINYTEGSSGQRDDNAVIFDLNSEPDGIIHMGSIPLWLGTRTQNFSDAIESLQTMQSAFVEIDHWGERPTGCPTCNRWQVFDWRIVPSCA